MAAGTLVVYSVFRACHVGGVKVETAAMFEEGKTILGIELHFHANSPFCFSKPMRLSISYIIFMLIRLISLISKQKFFSIFLHANEAY